MFKYGDFSGLYFPEFGLNTEIYKENTVPKRNHCFRKVSLDKIAASTKINF